MRAARIDIAGIVSEVGEGAPGLVAGDAVYGVAGVMVGGTGGFAEQAVTGHGLLAAAPAHVDPGDGGVRRRRGRHRHRRSHVAAALRPDPRLGRRRPDAGCPGHQAGRPGRWPARDAGPAGRCGQRRRRDAAYVPQTFELSDIVRAIGVKEAGGVPGKIAVKIG